MEMFSCGKWFVERNPDFFGAFLTASIANSKPHSRKLLYFEPTGYIP
jgi:hypothetical protein